MKNPDNKPLRIRETNPIGRSLSEDSKNYGIVLSNLAVAQSNLVRAGKDSALPHFLALVKELERIYGFKFEIVEPEVR